MRLPASLKIALIAGSTAAATACQSGIGDRPERAYVERPVEALYNNAAEQLDRRRFEEAILLFDEVERQHPYSEWARKSMVMKAYANYEARDYQAAIEAAQRYLALHPGGSEAAYAYYLIAISHFDRIVDVGRDQGTTELAKTALQDVTRRFPASEYAKDAALKMDMVNDQLAGKEMEIGRWYLRRNQTLAAVNRFRTVVEEYDTTTHSEEALHRLVESYLTLGLRQEALAAGAVLGYNHPNSDWYRMSYALLSDEGLSPDTVSDEDKRTWLQRLIPGGK